MPKMTTGRSLFAERHLAQRVAMERRRRGWTYASLETRTKQAGCAIAASALWKIENPPGGRPRRITVDELVVLSRVFGLPMAELVMDPAEALPEHLAATAEQAALILHQMYLLELEVHALAEDHARHVSDLYAGLRGQPEVLEKVKSLFEARQAPEWVVGTEERHAADIIRELMERAVRSTEESP